MPLKQIELLAPAGDLERLKVDLLYGADAVYVGGEYFSLRANATNFSLEELKEGCDFAHQLGKKVYFTCNIVFHEEDRIKMQKDAYLEKVVEAGVDAFIMSDPFLIDFLHKKYPSLEVHVSTQDSITNYEEALFYQTLGAKRVVLARELSLLEIKEIIEKTNLEVEVFIHGAMCTCYSGRCALSSYVTNRDPNRGGCSQVCRFAFTTQEDGKFTLATKDLNLAPYIKQLIEIGVKSFKVEGRMRSIYYLATVIGTYRKLMDRILDGTLDETFVKKAYQTLSRVANRPTSSHYLLKEADDEDQYYTGRQELSNQDFVGLVQEYDGTHLKLLLRNYLQMGEQVELFTAEGKEYCFPVTLLLDAEKNEIQAANHPDEIYFLPVSLPKTMSITAYSMLRKCI